MNVAVLNARGRRPLKTAEAGELSPAEPAGSEWGAGVAVPFNRAAKTTQSQLAASSSGMHLAVLSARRRQPDRRH